MSIKKVSCVFWMILLLLARRQLLFHFFFYKYKLKLLQLTRRQAICLTRSYHVDAIRRWRKLMLVQDGPSEVTTAVKACGRERIQQLRAITLQKKKSPSFSMLRLYLSKVRKIYCSSAVNLGMIFFSRLTFLSKVNNQTYGFSINIDTGGCAFLSMPRRWLFVRRCGLK